VIASIKKFEKIIISSLVVMMALVLFLSTLGLGWINIKDMLSPP